MMSTFLVFVLLAVCAFMGYKLYFKSTHVKDKEQFSTEDDDDIVDVAAAYKRIRKEVASPEDIRRIMKKMRKERSDEPDGIIRREMIEEKEAAEELKKFRESRPDEPAVFDIPEETAAEKPSPLKQPPPVARNERPEVRGVDERVLQKIEDELESIANRVDGLIDELSVMRRRRDPRESEMHIDEPVYESFVPYHPV